MEDAGRYILQNIGKYPDGFCAVIYGVARVENTLQDGIGSGGRTAAKQGMKELIGKAGTGSLYGNSTNSVEAYTLQTRLAKQMDLLVDELTISGDENSATVTYERCRFSDACNAIAQEGIGKAGGGFECTNARSGTASLEFATKLPHDSEVLKFNPPNCTYRIYKV